MIRRPVPHRTVAVLLAVVLAAGATGCGGSDEDGGDAGGSDAYVATWNEVCTTLATAQTTLQTDAVKAQKVLTERSAEAQAQSFAAPVTTFSRAMVAALERVDGLEAPEPFEDFQTLVARAAPETISTLRRLERPLAAGDAAATQQVIGRIDQKNLFPTIPSALKKQSTACTQF